MNGLTYEEEYFFMHNENFVEVVKNVLNGLNVTVFKKTNGDYFNGVTIYNLTLNQVENLFKALNLNHMVLFMDYQAEYGYDEFLDVHDNEKVVEVTFKNNMFDLEDLK